MQRRDFLALLTAWSFQPLAGWAALSDAPASGALLYSASEGTQDRFALTVFNRATQASDSIPVPMRGHGLLALAAGRVLLFGRRPAMVSALVDTAARQVIEIPATPGRHFNGHGCLSADGGLLFTAENDYDNKRGVVGVRDSQTLQHVQEYDILGLDPHDIRLMPDGKTLVVANGGIETHPDFGRRKLNIDTMQPSLVYLDAASGKKIDEYRLPDNQLSIRHLLVTPSGDVGVALQYEGDLQQKQPRSLVAWQRQGGDLTLLRMVAADLPPFQGYMADLALDSGQGLLMVTSPRGGRVGVWDVATQDFLYAQALPEPSGIVFLPAQGEFLVSSVEGGVYAVQANRQRARVKPVQVFADVHWDNHWVTGVT